MFRWVKAIIGGIARQSINVVAKTGLKLAYVASKGKYGKSFSKLVSEIHNFEEIAKGLKAIDL